MTKLTRSISLAVLAALTAAAAGCSAQSPLHPDAATSQALVRPGSLFVKPSTNPPPFVFPDDCCYYNGTIVRTVVPPASNPSEGRDNFYGITNGVAGQKGVVAVAPGDTGYHGGHWKFHSVTFIIAPYLLTSQAAVLAAAAAGDVTVTRVPEMDFKCPIQP